MVSVALSDAAAKGTMSTRNSVPAKILSLFSDLSENSDEQKVTSALLLVNELTSSAKKQVSYLHAYTIHR